MHRDFAAVVHAGIDAHLAFFRRRRGKAHQSTGGGQETACRVFGVDPAFDGPAVRFDFRLRERQFFARRDANHQLDEVKAGDHLGDRMFDLQTGVHFQEVEGFVGTDDEFDRPGALVIDRLGQRHRLFAHRLADRFIDEG